MREAIGEQTQAAAELAATGAGAIEHVARCAKARAALKRRVSLARDCAEAQRRARMELAQAVEAARVDAELAHCAKHWPVTCAFDLHASPVGCGKPRHAADVTDPPPAMFTVGSR